MKNSEQPIYPSQIRQIGDNEYRLANAKDIREGMYLTQLSGLTKREYAAIMTLQGLLSSYSGDVAMPDDQTMSKWAVSLADALFEELEK